MPSQDFLKILAVICLMGITVVFFSLNSPSYSRHPPEIISNIRSWAFSSETNESSEGASITVSPARSTVSSVGTTVLPAITTVAQASTRVLPGAGTSTRTSCGRLLTDEEIFEDSFGVKRLRSQGCFMQNYTAPTPLTSRCFTSLSHHQSKTNSSQGVRIVLIGDSRMRQLQHKLNWLITGNWTDIDNAKGDRIRQPAPLVCDEPLGGNKVETGQCNLTLSVPSLNLTVQRWWATMVEPGMAHFFLTRILAAVNDSGQLPSIVIINSGAWLLKSVCHEKRLTTENCTGEYRKIISHIKPLIMRLSALTSVIWTPQTPVAKGDWSMESNKLVPVFNEIASELLEDTNVHFWWSSRQAYERFSDTPDGLHWGSRTLIHNAQVVMNYLCNAADLLKILAVICLMGIPLVFFSWNSPSYSRHPPEVISNIRSWALSSETNQSSKGASITVSTARSTISSVGTTILPAITTVAQFFTSFTTISPARTTVALVTTRLQMEVPAEPLYVHYVLFQRTPLQPKEVSFLDCVSVLAVLKNLRPDAVYIHTNAPDFWPFDPCNQVIKNWTGVELVPAHRSFVIGGRRVHHIQHEADVLKLQLLQQYGGLALDFDVYLINGTRFREVYRAYPCVLSGEAKVHNKLNIGFVACRKGAAYPTMLLREDYLADYRPDEWVYNSGIRPHQLYHQHEEMGYVAEGISDRPDYEQRHEFLHGPQRKHRWTDKIAHHSFRRGEGAYDAKSMETDNSSMGDMLRWIVKG
ncbi:hypothetical protein BV898_17169 [Hypsibius exemplaris]|uniref:Uncharacterized protein n=1 Tax=Hypsibius exemplaris TaxID=2072580 RepID=A0A9X6NGS1_HYPEX|nr:hypothetical protein BV898_17169 [Hypsibius exemplaris]